MFKDYYPGAWSLGCPCGVTTDFPHRLIFQQEFFYCPSCNQELSLGALKKAAAALDNLFSALDDCQGAWIVTPPLLAFAFDPASPGRADSQE